MSICYYSNICIFISSLQFIQGRKQRADTSTVHFHRDFLFDVKGVMANFFCAVFLWRFLRRFVAFCADFVTFLAPIFVAI